MEFPFDPYKAAGWAFAVFLFISHLVLQLRGWVKKRLSAEGKYGDPEIVKKVAELDERIHEALTELRQQADAARVLIYQFHNGEQFFSGAPLQRMTCSYESRGGGFASIIDESRDVVASLMSGVIDRMWDDTPLVCAVDQMKEGFARTRLESLNVEKFAVAPLYHNRLVIGCLKLHWTRSDDAPSGPWLDGTVKETVRKIELLLAQRLLVTGTHS